MKRSLAVLVISALSLCTSVQLFAGEPSAKIKAFFKPEILEVLSGVEHVDVFRIKPTNAGFAILATGSVWNGEKAKQVAALFLDEKSYEWVLKKACDPMPGVLFRIYKSEKYVEAALCFECGIVAFSIIEPKGKAIANQSNDFDPARAQLVKWAKEALPNDAVVQALKEKNE
jgi:hypothetical protein